jgi:hypothetical protein
MMNESASLVFIRINNIPGTIRIKENISKIIFV